MRPDATEMRRLLDAIGQPSARLDADGNAPVMAGATDPPPQNPVANPLGPASISGTEITVDAYLNPPTRIPAIIRNLVAGNEGYFAERIFATPGMTVQGGAVIYEESFPEDHFLPADQSIAPRAPGSEAPLLGSTRHDLQIAKPESWAGSIEVHDEARRRNDVSTVRRQFQQAANTFADRIQSRALETLDAAVTSWGRTVQGINWRTAHAAGTVNADPATMPHADFGRVLKQFINDKAGMRPNLVVLNPEDSYFLELLYSNIQGGWRGILSNFGLEPLVSPQAPEGAPYFLVERGVGDMMFEKPLDQEYTREGKRKTDVFTIESVPVFVAIDASSIVQLETVNHS